MTIQNKDIIQRTMEYLSHGDPISDMELQITITALELTIETLKAINRKEDSLMTRDLYHDLETLIGYQNSRKQP